MPKVAFIQKQFRAASLSMIDTVNDILEEYRQLGYKLSLRQLYYQCVARGYIENSQKSYKNMGSLISDGRQAGLIDWDMIEDRGRDTVIPSHWNSPAEIVRAAANQFRIDKWEDQPYYVTVMVEKDALSGVLEPVCRRLDIGITANKGYSSSSTMYEIGQKLNYEYYENDKHILVIYLGDHDPSGIDMTRDVEDRLSMYSTIPADSMQVVRLALNMDQVERWNPPPNPAKETDSRFDSYRRKYGDTSWELDAINPTALAQLVTTEVEEVRDDDLWDEAVKRETKMKTDLIIFADTYKDKE